MNVRSRFVRSTLSLAAMLSAAASAHASAPSEWKSFGNGSYRLEADGNVSCLSTDGVNCYPLPFEQTRVDPKSIRPVVCGDAYKALYGVTGYDTRHHWCSDAYANLFAKWQNYAVLGFPVLIAFDPAGHAMCASTDYNNCHWNDRREQPTPGVTLKPVVCGKSMQEAFHLTGYESPSHWCNTREIMVRRTDLPQSAFIPPVVQVRTPGWAWTLADEPAWVARVRLVPSAKPALNIPLTQQGKAISVMWFVDERYSRVLGQPEVPVEGGVAVQEATFAVAVTAEGEIKFQRANSWAANVLLPQYTVQVSKRDGLAQSGDAFYVFPWATTRRDLVTEVVATRRRKPADF